MIVVHLELQPIKDTMEVMEQHWLPQEQVVVVPEHLGQTLLVWLIIVVMVELE